MTREFYDNGIRLLISRFDIDKKAPVIYRLRTSSGFLNLDDAIFWFDRDEAIKSLNSYMMMDPDIINNFKIHKPLNLITFGENRTPIANGGHLTAKELIEFLIQNGYVEIIPFQLDD